jgi:hypothetical protein
VDDEASRSNQYRERHEAQRSGDTLPRTRVVMTA